MQREIGSDFWLEPGIEKLKKKKFDFSENGVKGTDYAFLSTGRSAIRFVLQQAAGKIKAKRALVPAYTCETVIKPFWEMGYEVSTYPVSRCLMLQGRMLEQAILEKGASVVLFHRFFGFDTLRDCKTVIRNFQEQQILFIEDRTQNIFSTHSDMDADYTIGSLRKWFGLLDGGFAVSSRGHFSDKPVSYDKRLEYLKLKACEKKYLYMTGQEDNKPEFLKLYQQAEEAVDSQKDNYAVSPVSEIVWSNADYAGIKNKRRNNYAYVYHRLKNCDAVRIVTPELSEQDTPLYLMISTKNRNRLQERLRAHDIYAPIVWKKPERLYDVCVEAEEMYQHGLCLPIDQRYGTDDMERMADAVLTEAVNEN